MPSHPRRKKLVLPGLQLRLTGLFVLLATLGMWLQFLLLRSRTLLALEGLEEGGDALSEELSGILMGVVGFTFAVMLPLLLAAGIVISSRVAGPAHRFEVYLRSLIEGQDPGPCTLRRGDELKPLLGAINDTANALRDARAARNESEPEAA